MKKKLLAFLATAAICQPMLALEVMTVKLQNGDSILYCVDKVKEVNFGPNSSILDESQTPLKFTILSDGTAEVIKDESYKTLTSVSIPERITKDGNIYKVSSIGSNAFKNCEDLESVEIPSSVTMVMDSSFYNCTSLASIEMTSVSKIGEGAFAHCSSLASVTFSSSLNKISQNAFISCVSLKNIELPDGITTIEEGVFSNCTSLESVKLSNCITNIGESAFSMCSALKNIELPDGLYSIDVNAFILCSALSKIYIPSSVVYINAGAFMACDKLDVFVDSKEEEIIVEDLAFKGCHLVSYLKDKYVSSGTIDGYEFVDLGLSVLWATANIGAKHPWDCGNFYSWGEIDVKEMYTYDNSITHGKSQKELREAGILDAIYSELSLANDAATQNWSEKWNMPREADIIELINGCTFERIALGYEDTGIDDLEVIWGYKVTSKAPGNNNWIFLPLYGYMVEDGHYGKLDDFYEKGCYWTSSLYLSDDAYIMDLNSSGYKLNTMYQCLGCLIRPVTFKSMLPSE